MNLANQITPENIIDITIQYRLTESQVKVAIPSIYIRYYGEIGDASTIRQATILLAEILPYIKYLQIQAALLADGSTVIAEQINTNLSTVITVGLPLATTSPASITLITPTGLHDSDITGIINVSGILSNIISCSNLPAIFYITLPKINGNFFENDYSISTGGDVDSQTIRTIDADSNWIVFVSMYSNPLAIGVGSITFTAKTLNANVFIENTNNNPSTVLNSLSLDTNPLVNVGGTGFANFPVSPLEVKQFASARSHLKQSGVKTGTFNGDFSASSDIVGSIIAVGKTVIETPFTVPSTGNYDFPFDYDMTDEGYLYLRLNFPSAGIIPPPVGVAVQAAAGNSSASSDLCPAPLATYFTNDGTITTGKTVYTDIALSIPLAGNNFILSPDGVIYAIDNVTGVVGASSGNSCALPITGKNMFVINTAGGDILVDGNLYSFPAGTNYNVVIKSDSAITNSSGFTKVFKFYKQAPFIPANYTGASASPYTMLSGSNLTLPNDLTDWNYMSIT